MDRQQHLDLGTIARTVIASNFYMTLGTADFLAGREEGI